MPRRQLVMVAVVAATVLGVALLLWRGEGLAGAFALIALAALILLQLDARRRLSDLAADVRRNRAELRTAAARMTTHESELKDFGRQLNVASRAAGQARDDARTTAEQLTEVQKALDEEARSARSHRRATRPELKKVTRATVNQTQALLQLHHQFAPTAPLPAVDGWAMEPTSLLELVTQVSRLRPKLVVECGSGTSTLWIAYALRRNGTGRIVALDHDAEYAASTSRVIADHGLTDWAHVQHAPLVPTDTPRGQLPWYSANLTGLDEIELLVVDGPPKATGDLARYPALPVLAGLLAPHARILFDDADRPDELAVLDAWKQTHPLEVEHELAGRALLLRMGIAS